MRADVGIRRRLALLIVAAASAAVALAAAAPASAGMVLAPAYTDSAADNVSQPIFVTAPPGDSSRLFVVERGGRIRLSLNGVIQDTPFLDIHTLVSTSGEGGLLSMAVAPDYATTRLFYVYFIEPPDAGSSNGDIRIEEFKANPDMNTADPLSRRLILQIQHDTYSNHYGGQLQFGPDGVLYAGTGDGGSGGDPLGNGQNPATQLGKLLAIDRFNASATVAAMGLRNPFRFSFDRTSGDLVIGDVGQDKWEEVDYVPAGTLTGLNFGWNCWEGFEHRLACNPAPYTPPILTYPNAHPSAITGGVVVRDPALTPLFGRYVYADFYAGLIHSMTLTRPTATDDRVEAFPKVSQLVAFGQDADAHVYVVSLAGRVWRIACDGSCGPAPGGGGGGGGGAGGGAGNPPPTGQPPASQPAADQPPAAEQPPASGGSVPPAHDSSAPVLRIRAAQRQDVLRSGRVRLSVSCDEDCFLRVSARAGGLGMHGSIQRLGAGRRAVITLGASRRIMRALARHGTVAVGLRARDAAGNLATATRTVLVRRR